MRSPPSTAPPIYFSTLSLVYPLTCASYTPSSLLSFSHSLLSSVSILCSQGLVVSLRCYRTSSYSRSHTPTLLGYFPLALTCNRVARLSSRTAPYCEDQGERYTKDRPFCNCDAIKKNILTPSLPTLSVLSCTSPLIPPVPLIPSSNTAATTLLLPRQYVPRNLFQRVPGAALGQLAQRRDCECRVLFGEGEGAGCAGGGEDETLGLRCLRRGGGREGGR